MKKSNSLLQFSLLVVSLFLLLSACSQPASLSVGIETLTVTVGDEAVAISTSLKNSKREIQWTLSGVGTLSSEIGETNSYTPPSEGEASTATIVVKAGILEKTIDITIKAKPPEAILESSFMEVALSSEVTTSAIKTLNFKNSGNKVLSFTLTSSEAWLVVKPAKGDVAIGNLQEVEITGTCDMDVEKRSATLTLDSNGGTSNIAISIDCTRPGAILDVLSKNLALSTEISKSTSKTLSFKNSGDEKVLEFTAKSNNPWLSLTPPRGSVAIGATQNLNVSATCGTAIEQKMGSVTIESNGGKSDVTISLDCTRLGAVLDVPVTNLILNTEVYKSTNKTLSFKNSGEEKVLSYTAKSNNAWLSVAPLSGNVAIEATQNLSISATCGAAIEKRVGSITIRSNGGNSNVGVSVNCINSSTWNLPADINNVSYLNQLNPSKKTDFSFFYAGHAYGSPANLGGSTTDYPAKGLLGNLSTLKKHDFAVFGGDMIYSCLPSSLVALRNTLLTPLAMPIFNSSGNHDMCLSTSSHYGYGRNIPIQYGRNLFLIISSPNKRTSESADMSWLIDQINKSKTNSSIKNIFVFTHIPTFLGLAPELQQAAQLVNNPLQEKASVIQSLTKSMTDFKSSGKNLYWFSGDVGAKYPLIYHRYASNIYFLASGMFDNTYDHVLSIQVKDGTQPNISIIGLNGRRFSPVESYNYQWLARFR